MQRGSVSENSGDSARSTSMSGFAPGLTRRKNLSMALSSMTTEVLLCSADEHHGRRRPGQLELDGPDVVEAGDGGGRLLEAGDQDGDRLGVVEGVVDEEVDAVDVACPIRACSRLAAGSCRYASGTLYSCGAARVRHGREGDPDTEPGRGLAQPAERSDSVTATPSRCR